MRIISGKLKGRVFDSVSGHRTHPMSEKMRGAIFNSLGDISGLSVLDAYAGTGALSIESVSRGASQALAIDPDIRANSVIHQNIEQLGLEDSVKVVRAYARAWSRRHPNQKFDILLLDPPYDAVAPKDLLLLTKHVKLGGIIVLSLPPDNGFRLASSRQELISHKSYGDSELFFYRQLFG